MNYREAEAGLLFQFFKTARASCPSLFFAERVGPSFFDATREERLSAALMT